MRALPLFALLPAAALAQQPHPDAAAVWMPLCKGAHWEFRIDRAGATLQHSCDDEGEVDLPDGNRGHQLRCTRGKDLAFEYWALRQDGVYEYTPLLTMERLPLCGVEDMPPARWLQAPLGIDTHWQFDQPFVGQIASGLGANDTEERPWPHVHHDASLVSPSEKLTVPAGSFDTAHVKITFALVGTDDPKPWQGTRELWFARGIGIVKRVERDRDGAIASTTELVKFTPGVAEPDPLAALQRWLAATPPWSQYPDCKPEPVSLGNASCLLFGRCYRLRWQQQTGFVHVLDGVVSPLSSSDAAAFAQMLQAHGRKLDADMLGAIAEAAVRLECAARDLPAPQLTRPTYREIAGADTRGTASIEGDVRVGAAVRGRANGSATCTLGAGARLTEVKATIRQ